MVCGMQLTLLGACKASGQTALDGSPHNLQVNGRAPCQDGRRSGARVGTVEVRTHTLDQRCDVRFRQTGIGTRSAGLKASDTLFDAADQCFIVGRPGPRVGLGHLSDDYRHGKTPLVLNLVGGLVRPLSRAVAQRSAPGAFPDSRLLPGPPDQAPRHRYSANSSHMDCRPRRTRVGRYSRAER